jgi:hypothetical protein
MLAITSVVVVTARHVVAKAAVVFVNPLPGTRVRLIAVVGTVVGAVPTRLFVEGSEALLGSVQDEVDSQVDHEHTSNDSPYLAF